MRVDENEVDRSRLIGKCTVETPGSTCTIGKTETVSRTISADFGASSESISAAINVSARQSIAVTIGCQSEKLGTNQEYVAFPTQTLYYYQVVTDEGAYTTDLGQYIPSGNPPYVSPVAVTAAYDGWFRCRSRQLQS